MKQSNLYWNKNLFPDQPTQKQLDVAAQLPSACFMHNCIFNVPNDVAIAPAMQNGIYELHEIKQLEKILHPEDVFIDVGACVGLFSVVAAKQVGERGHVLSIEPNDCTYLKWNITNNDCHNVSVINHPVGDKKHMVYLDKDPINFGNSMISKTNNGNAMQMLTIDDIVASRHRVSAIKIDVQGFEIEVLHGAFKTIQENKRIYLLVEFSPEHLIETGHSVKEFLDLLYDKLGFRIFMFDVHGIKYFDNKMVCDFNAGYQLQCLSKNEIFTMAQSMKGFINLWCAR